jgi:thioredoxin reductase/bacterioferritin-associated ferredoxin
MSGYYDAAVIGAGPAGMAAASSLAELGLGVILLDEQFRPGGQIYRNIEKASPQSIAFLGEEYGRGGAIAERFRKSGAAYLAGASVWQVSAEGTLCYSWDGRSTQIRAGYIIIATGAMERPRPLPGWELPGVMGAGAANNLAKEADLQPTGQVVLAGSGPLLLLETTLLLKKGVKIAAILETTPKIPSPLALPRLPAAMRRTDFLLKGLAMVQEIRRSGVPHHKGVVDICCHGREKVETVSARAGEKQLNYPADIVLLHFGVIPSTHIFRQIGCHMLYNREQRYWYPQCDPWGRTNHERVFAAGDGATVTGALAAEYRGELAALEVAHCLGILPAYERDAKAEPLRAALRHDGYPRPLIDTVFAPGQPAWRVPDDTVLCRCENVTVGEVRKVIGEGVTEVNEMKVLTRCGMGPCQGRMCGPGAAEIIAEATGLPPDRAGLLNIRPPLKPLPLGEIAAMELAESSSGPANIFKNQGK